MIENYNDELEILLSDDETSKQESLILSFDGSKSQYLDMEFKLDKLRQKFVDDFSINNLLSLPIEKYVIGFKDNETFCYRIENELKNLGKIHGSTSNKFGIYYGKEGNDTELKYRYPSRFGHTAEEAYQSVIIEIINLISAGEKHNISSIRTSNLTPIFRGKILSTYFPEDYLCIFSEVHLDYFCNKLNLSISKGSDIIDKQMAIIAWKNNNAIMKEWGMHLFSTFLYNSYGKPLKEREIVQSLQAERDQKYPRDFVVPLNISQKKWKELVLNKDVFKEENITLLKRIYRKDNHATTCYELSLEDGVKPQSYISPIVSLGKRIIKECNLNKLERNDGKNVWWRVVFWGRNREDGLFEWKLRPELATALASIYPDLDDDFNNIEERKNDEKLIQDLRNASFSNVQPNFKFTGISKEKVTPNYHKGHKVYPRDRKIAMNSLSHAQYKCEIDSSHPSFLRKNTNLLYTEPHHLVPIAYSDSFDVSLDIEENIVSLCSNCHNHIHYGHDADKLITQLYSERKEHLEKVGIKVSLEKLLEMYGY